MSNYGLYIKNANGETQIDGNYSNFTDHETGTWSIDGLTIASLSTPTLSPLIVTMKAPPELVHCRALLLNSDATAFDRVLIDGDFELSNVNYRAFRPFNTIDIPSSGNGIAVYNSDGSPVFSDSKPCMKLISHHSLNNPLANGGNGLVNYVDVTVQDADNNYFYLFPRSRWVEWYYKEIIGDDIYTIGTVGFKKINSTTIRVGIMHTSGRSSVPDGNYTPPLQLVEVNITG